MTTAIKKDLSDINTIKLWKIFHLNDKVFTQISRTVFIIKQSHEMAKLSCLGTDKTLRVSGFYQRPESRF